MDKKLIAKAKKHNVDIFRKTLLELPNWEELSIPDFLKKLNEFIGEEDPKNFKIGLHYVSFYSEDGQNIVISGIVSKSESTIEKEIELAKEKRQLSDAKKKISNEKREKSQLAELIKKYPNVVKELIL